MGDRELDFDRFDALTFDCYGTLIDWEAGILAGLRPALAANGVDPSDDELLEVYSRAEAAAEAGPYRRYREILAGCLGDVCGAYGVTSDEATGTAFGGSVGTWPAFPDSSAALRQLQSRFRLGVITNCDDDLFAASNERLGVDLRLDRDRAVGGKLQAGSAQLRGRVRRDRAAARANPPRRAEPVP